MATLTTEEITKLFIETMENQIEGREIKEFSVAAGTYKLNGFTYIDKKSIVVNLKFK